MGYGSIQPGNAKMNPVKAHRASWIMRFGVIPDGFHVCHHCDNRLCIRPDHLFLGTDMDNIRDAARKGRLAVGADYSRSTLTDSKVIQMRKEYESGKFSQSALGIKYGISRSAVEHIILRINWKHI